MKHFRGCKNNVFTEYYNTPGKNLFPDDPDRRLIERNTKPFNYFL